MANEYLKKIVSISAIVVGAGLFAFGASGYLGRGWFLESRVEMAIGASLFVGGILFRLESK